MNGESENPNGPGVSIRLASGSDAIALANLRFAFRSSLCKVAEAERAFVERCTRWMQRRLSEDSAWRCWIAEVNDVPIGNLWAQLIEKIPNPTDEPEQHAYLTNLYVLEAHRDRGVGSLLLAAALDWIRTMDVHAIVLWPTERSTSFYLRHGFSVRGDVVEMILTDDGAALLK